MDKRQKSFHSEYKRFALRHAKRNSFLVPVCAITRQVLSLILLSWIPVLIVLMFKYLCIPINWTVFKSHAVDGFRYED